MTISDSLPRNKAVVRELTECVWNRCQLDRIGDFYSPDFVADYRPHAPLREGYDTIRGMVERAWTAFPDYHEELRELIAEGDLVVARFTISGTQKGQWGVLPPTGKRVEFDEIVILELREGKVDMGSSIDEQLYDLTIDPDTLTDVSAAQPAVVQAMKAYLP